MKVTWWWGFIPGRDTQSRSGGEDRFRELADKIVSELGAKVIWSPTRASHVHRWLALTRISWVQVFLFDNFLASFRAVHTFVGNDSGPMHMAAGLGVRVVAISGPELPEWFGPMGAGT